MAQRVVRPNLDPLKICAAVRSRFPEEQELSRLVDNIEGLIKVRASLSANSGEIFINLGSEVLRDTTRVVNLIKAKLSSKGFADFIGKVQSKAVDAACNDSGMHVPAQAPGSITTESALRYALGADFQRVSLTDMTISYAIEAANFWLHRIVMKLHGRVLARAPDFSFGTCKSEEALLRKELSAVQLMTRLSGLEPQFVREEEIRLLAMDEAEKSAVISRKLRRISSKDISAILKLEDFPDEFSVKFSSNAAHSAALVDLKTRVASQAPS